MKVCKDFTVNPWTNMQPLHNRSAVNMATTMASLYFGLDILATAILPTNTCITRCIKLPGKLNYLIVSHSQNCDCPC